MWGSPAGRTGCAGRCRRVQGQVARRGLRLDDGCGRLGRGLGALHQGDDLALRTGQGVTQVRGALVVAGDVAQRVEQGRALGAESLREFEGAPGR